MLHINNLLNSVMRQGEWKGHTYLPETWCTIISGPKTQKEDSLITIKKDMIYTSASFINPMKFAYTGCVSNKHHSVWACKCWEGGLTYMSILQQRTLYKAERCQGWLSSLKKNTHECRSTKKRKHSTLVWGHDQLSFCIYFFHNYSLSASFFFFSLRAARSFSCCSRSTRCCSSRFSSVKGDSGNNLRKFCLDPVFSKQAKEIHTHKCTHITATQTEIIW